MTTALVVYQPGLDGTLFSRMGLLQELERTLCRLEREYAADVDKMRRFEQRYRPAVGERYDELDRLRARVRGAWQLIERAREGDAVTNGHDAGEGDRASDSELAEWGRDVTPGPGDAARLLFLALARQVHPDLATDEMERVRRHDVMSEATLAYRNNDERRLQWLIEHWQAECDPIPDLGPGALWLRTNRQIAWLRYRIREMRHSLAQLHASGLAYIMEQDQQARLSGRNLILELRKLAQADIEAAYRDLDLAREAIEDLDPALRDVVRAETGL